jgi:DNA-binding MarR family transcriptional regulator
MSLNLRVLAWAGFVDHLDWVTPSWTSAILPSMTKKIEPAKPFPVSVPQGMVRLTLTVAAIYAEVSRSLGLTAQQAQLLCAARRSTAVGDLAAFLRCERSSVSHLVDRAASRGLVKRRGTENDGRVKVVELSSDGQKVVQKFMTALEARLKEAIADWPERERVKAARILNELADGLDASGSVEAFPEAATA